jgi:hypothetical protein
MGAYGKAEPLYQRARAIFEKTGSLGIAVGYPNILWLMNHYYPQEHPHDYPH